MRAERWIAVAVICAALGWLFWLLTEDWREARARRLEIADILARTDAQTLLSEGNALCPEQRESTYWICGTVLNFKLPSSTQLCSSPESPRYIGDLGYSFLRWDLQFRTALPLNELRTCDHQPCATLSVLPKDGFVPQSPPANLPQSPRWPDFNAVSTYGPWAPSVWATLDGAPVRFHFGDFAPENPEGYQPDITLTAHHPELPFYVRLRLPFLEKSRWEQHLEDAFSVFSAAVISTGRGQSCDIPPVGTLFDFVPINPFTLRDVADHLAELERPEL